MPRRVALALAAEVVAGVRNMEGPVYVTSAVLVVTVRTDRCRASAQHRIRQVIYASLHTAVAAVLRVKLEYLDRDNQRRLEIAAMYFAGLTGEGVTLPVVHGGAEHVYHQYVVRSSERDALQDYLQCRGIASLVHYSMPVHLQPAYAQRVAHAGLALSERAASEVLSLPMYPELENGDVERVVEAIRSFCRRATRNLAGLRRQA